MTARRLEHSGRVQRDAPLSFRWNGRAMTGFRGDTLASALLANGVSVAARSFKYHRPRGIAGQGQEEAGALVTVGEGARTTPNLKPTTVELEDGLVARPQNCWPSVDRDLGEVNDLLSPFLAAGFYYKTFMGVTGGTREWMLAERAIRAAAGLGRASPRADPDWYEHVHGHCDVLVVGSGPAGLAAALECAEAGLDVVLAEQDFEMGGDLLTDGKVGEHSAEYHRVESLGQLRCTGRVRLMPRTMVFGLYDHGVAGLTERVRDPGADGPRERMHILRTRRTIVAAGALERPFVFGDNDRPGVMSADAARAYLRRWGVAPGDRIVVAATNDSGYRAAGAFGDAGLDVTLLDSRAAAAPERVAHAQAAGVDVRLGHVPVRAIGRTGVRAVEVGRHEGAGAATPAYTLRCDLVAVSGGWSPALHLTSHARARPTWSASDACFLPGLSGGDVSACGAAAGVWRREACIASGRAAGREAARALGATTHRRLSPPEPGGWDTPIDPVWEVRVHGRKLKGFVDLANDVTAADLRLAQAEGYESVEHAKRYTTLGMAPDQGKTSGVVGMALLAQARGETPDAVGTTTFRPPYAPVSMGIFAGAEGGAMWEPVRRTPFHAAAEAAGAVFVDAGLWKRAWYFPRRGEGLAAASRREAAMVRDAVGLCDVSTLGKLRVQGPDAAAFLDRIYSNLMSTLPVGKARYGFMLREDGAAYDDGTVWRWSETDFLVTATTSHAAGVQDHLELWAARWPELRVDIACETESWAALALSGPRARGALGRATTADVSDGALPFMGLASAMVCGVPAQIARISFSGELAYEIYVRPCDAEVLWQGLGAAAEAEGGGLYGLEALDILRVEKGHVTGREIDGRVTLSDLGLPRMMSRKKAFLGQALACRPGLTDPARPSLVGLEPADGDASFMAGAVLAPPGHRKGHGVGHVASIADSPARGRRIGLGFVEGGLAEWEGRIVIAKDPVADAETTLRVVSPHFVDPAGERLRG